MPSKMTRIMFLWIAASMAYGQDPNPASESRIKAEDFAILPWGRTPAEKPVLEEIYNCGFNLAGFVAPEGLDAVAAAGLQCIVSDPSTRSTNAATTDEEVNRRVTALVDRIGKHPAVFGYYLQDEPSAKEYPHLARLTEMFRKAAPEARSYINLYPNTVSVDRMGVPTYEEYVESFVQTVKPPFISYDHYALLQDGSVGKSYFQNLEIIRAAALRHNLPFWNIVLSTAHFHLAEPTEAGLRFQVYTTLAYGGRGISYFKYFSPSLGNYRLGPIDQFGDKTPTWYMMRRVNLQIHKLAPSYIKLKSVNVFHHPEIPEGCTGLATSRFLDDIGSGKFVIGEFEGPDGVPHVLVVNKSLTRSSNLKVKFKSNGTIMQVDAYSGVTHRWGNEADWLAPGQGMLLLLQQ